MLAGLAALAASPLFAQAPEVDLRRYGWRPHPAQAESCSWTPDRLPLVNAVLDEAAVVEAARGIPGFEDADSHYIVSVAIDSTGALSDLTSIESTFGPDREPELLDLVMPHVRGRPEARVRRFRVGVFGGAPATVVVGPVQACSPLLANRATITRLLARLATDGRVYPGGSATVWIFVQKNGAPGEYRIDRSSGNGTLDQIAISVAREMRFLPARHEGVPHEVWISLPINLGTAP